MLPLKDLTDLKGFEKHWPTKGATEFKLVHDYLQKISYSIQDFNSLLGDNPISPHAIPILMIVYADWISDAVYRLPNCYRQEVFSGFSFSKQNQLEKAYLYLRAVRSFIVAHPLTTNEHPTYGLDGDLLCVDIGRYGRIMDLLRPPFRRITIENGIKEVNHIPKTDIILSAYSRQNGALHFEHIGIDPEDIRTSASLKIDRLFEMGNYLSKLKMRDYPPS